MRASMARLLILGGGERGRWLAGASVAEGYVARVVTRAEANRPAIEAAGAECWIGDPCRLATVVGALDGVAIVCWLLGTAGGPEEQVRAVHGARLQTFLDEAVDTTMRGFVYEAAGTVPADLLAAGAAIAAGVTGLNSIPLRTIDAAPAERERWREQAAGAVDSLLSGD